MNSLRYYKHMDDLGEVAWLTTSPYDNPLSTNSLTIEISYEEYKKIKDEENEIFKDDNL